MPRSHPIRPGRSPSVEPGQKPGDQSVDPDGPDPGAGEETHDDEDGHRPQLPVDPVPREDTDKGGDQQEDADLRKQGEIGSGLTRQSHRMIAARPDDGQT